MDARILNQQSTEGPRVSRDRAALLVTEIANIAELRSTTDEPAAVYLAGAKVLNDGGQGFFRHDPDDMMADDGGTVLVTATGARYLRVYSGAMRVAWFGGFNAAAVAACLAAALARKKAVFADAGIYDMGSAAVRVTQRVEDFSFVADPQAIFQSSGDGSYAIFSFSDIGANVSWVGGQYQYVEMPRTRAADTLDFWGSAIRNMYLADLCVNNSANFGVWVRGLGPSGCSHLVARNIRVSNTRGDGFHVENFDNQVVIDGIIGLNNGDDVCAVVNHQPTHPDPTYDVLIDNVMGQNPTTAVLKLLGVDGFVVGKVIGRGGSGATACVLNLAVGDGYGTVLRNGSFGAIVGENITNVIFPGVAPGFELGNIVFGGIVGSGITGNGVQIVGSETTSIHDLNFGKICLTGATAAGMGEGAAANFGVWICFADHVVFDTIQMNGFYQNINVYRCNDITFGGGIDSADAFPCKVAGSTDSFGVQIQYCRDLTLNDVTYRKIKAQGTKSGIIINFNDGVVTHGLLVSPPQSASTPYIFGGNTRVKGYIDRVIWSISEKAVTAGVTFAVPFEDAVEKPGLFLPLCPTVTAGTPQVLGVAGVNGAGVLVTPTASGTISAVGVVEVLLN